MVRALAIRRRPFRGGMGGNGIVWGMGDLLEAR
jgi:hypothetical protein